MSTKHTPGPWHIGIRTAHSKRDVYGQLGELICLADGCQHPLALAQANAAYIVRACNSHDDLLAALKEIASIPDPKTGDRSPVRYARHVAKAAIAKAEC